MSAHLLRNSCPTDPNVVLSSRLLPRAQGLGLLPRSKADCVAGGYIGRVQGSARVREWLKQAPASSVQAIVGDGGYGPDDTEPCYDSWLNRI